MQALASPSNCCTPCDEQVSVSVPGPAGAAGAAGSNGTNGLNAYGLLAANFNQPAVLGTVAVTVDDSRWAAIYEIVFQESGGYYQVTAIPNSTHLTLKNLGYAGNAAPGAVIPSGSRITPGGLKGTDGTNGTGDMVAALNLSDVVSAPAALGNLGATTVGIALLGVAPPSAIRFLKINADNSVSARSVAQLQADLSLTPGTNVQAYDAELAALAAVVSAADKVPYFTGLGAAAVAAFTTWGRSIVAAATAAAGRTALGAVLPRYGLLGSKATVDLNAAASDNAISIESTKYRLDKIVVVNGSVNLTTATLGVFTLAGGAGTTVCADQSLAACTAASKFHDLTLGGGVTADVVTANTLYARVGTAQGGAATGDVFIFGWSLA